MSGKDWPTFIKNQESFIRLFIHSTVFMDFSKWQEVLQKLYGCSNELDPQLKNFFFEVPGSKYFRFCRP